MEQYEVDLESNLQSLENQLHRESYRPSSSLRVDTPKRIGKNWNALRSTMLVVCDAIDVELNRRGKSDLKHIVSMLARLIQQTETVSEGSIEYEYRSAEYEYEGMPEQINPPEPPVGSSLMGNHNWRPR